MTNPLLRASELPFGLPDYRAIRPEHYVEAVEAGAREQLAELADIARDDSPPTFGNTFVAFERSGQLLRRALQAFENVRAAHGTPEIQDSHARIQSVLTEHGDAVRLDAPLFARLSSLDATRLGGEDARLVEETLRDFRQAGAELDDADKAALRALNTRLSDLSTEYSRRLLAGMNDAAVHFATAGELRGLDQGELGSAAASARDAGHADGYLITLGLPTAQPVLERLELTESRRRIFEASVDRGVRGDHPTLDLAAEMAGLRADRAGLLGYANHAEYALETQTAPSLTAVMDRLAALVPAAVANAEREAAVLAESAGRSLEPWDWAHASAAVLRTRYDVDATALRPWFELESVVRDGVFRAATLLYGVTFAERHDLPVYHPDVRVWEVSDTDGSALGLFLGDYFARPTKTGGAWMNSIRLGAGLLGELPVVTNNLNITRPAAGGPALVSLDELRTLFHEFGHALHGLFSAAMYPSLAGTAVPRDFVEYPSQVNEMWSLWPEVADGYIRHHLTGEPLPDGTLERLEAAALWGEGFATTEYLAAAVLDLAWHSLAPGERVADPLAFEDAALRGAGFDPAAVPPRYRTGYFKHIFGGGYAAGYYSYIWSQILDADTVEWFKERGGLTRENGDRFREGLLARGNTRDPLESYVDFRGRPAEIGPLLARRGLGV
ncbi:MAG: M3 family metallopeptidase [Arthrobacter sp.]|uniref:M3 family metallopeptidase n=1 Tax=Arthrobacter sp. TaxID=1667 RepID=UPI00348F85E2